MPSKITIQLFAFTSVLSFLSACDPTESIKDAARAKINEKAREELWLQKRSADSLAYASRVKVVEQRIANSPLGVSYSSFKADSDLNAYLPFTITNNTNKTVIGFYLLKVSTGGEERLGKFKRIIKPHKSTTIRIPSRKFRISSEEAIEKPEGQLGVILHNYVATPVFADGTSKYGYPIRPLRADAPL